MLIWRKGNRHGKAAIEGISEVWQPVLATVLTTIIAFLPVAYMQDIIGTVPESDSDHGDLDACIFFDRGILDSSGPCRRNSPCPQRNTWKPKTTGLVRSFSFALRALCGLEFGSSWMGDIFSIDLRGVDGLGRANATALCSFFLRWKWRRLNVRLQGDANTSKVQTRKIATQLATQVLAQHPDDVTVVNTTVGEARLGGLTGVRERGGNLSYAKIRFNRGPIFFEEGETCHSGYQETHRGA